MTGRQARLGRLTAPGGAWAMVALDHGVSMGPVAGLADPRAALRVAAAGATCLTVHRGLVPLAHAAAVSAAPSPSVRTAGILLHLSASTDKGPDPNDKRLVAGVPDALRLGCDGVSIHVNVGSATEATQIEEAGRVAAECEAWGVPLVAMMYPRGPGIKDPLDPDLLAHAARLGAELGADAVKVPYTGSKAGFAKVVQGCPAPVIVAGGAKRALDGLVRDLEAARQAGARGFSIGRNVFSQADPAAALARIRKVFA